MHAILFTLRNAKSLERGGGFLFFIVHFILFCIFSKFIFKCFIPTLQNINYIRHYSVSSSSRDSKLVFKSVLSNTNTVKYRLKLLMIVSGFWCNTLSKSCDTASVHIASKTSLDPFGYSFAIRMSSVSFWCIGHSHLICHLINVPSFSSNDP